MYEHRFWLRLREYKHEIPKKSIIFTFPEFHGLEAPLGGFIRLCCLLFQLKKGRKILKYVLEFDPVIPL